MTTTNSQGAPDAPLYPWLPLWERLLQTDDEGVLSDKEAGIRLGVSESKVKRYRTQGLKWWEVDDICIKRFGLLPFLVVGWDEWFGPALESLDVAV